MTETLHVLWINAGLSCDGDSVALTGATEPSIEDIATGIMPDTPPVEFHWPLLAVESGEAFLDAFHRAAAGELGPYLLVVEGSVANEAILDEGYFTGFGTDPDTGQPITLTTWLDRLAPGAWGVLAAGTCAAYGGIHGMKGNPTGAMGVADYLGWDYRSDAGLPVVCMPGCPTHPDSFAEVLLYLLRQYAGATPPIPLDQANRPRWLFPATAHEGCDRGGHYEQGSFATKLGEPTCIVKLGCWGPIVRCNVPKRGWMNGIGGCPNVGGVCIGCTMPGFPDRFMPFLEEPPGGKLSSFLTGAYGTSIRKLRTFTESAMDQEPSWRGPSPVLNTGYRPNWYNPPPGDDT